ncbi:hypothetical protein CFB82_41165 [Burkholderia sp. HI2714]|uniref:galactose oxidase-like domain-containing protein n=1 Tax=Burkholderia sp. HI2714 TaxID=2015359 RepID=UPI000B79DB3E|nr:galactose oxidase-like domain-containing protein [Burkholderia sp. HI2714]OXJ21495.1 hypothetical protein CFB82_41165 [Burkholderia sp. HI2714]
MKNIKLMTQGDRILHCLIVLSGQLLVALAVSGNANASQSMPDAGWIYEIHDKNSSLCLALNGAADGTSLQMAYCDGANNQRFKVTKNTDGTYALRAQQNAQTASHMCVTAKQGNDIGLAACDNNVNVVQRWQLTPVQQGYNIASHASGRCIVARDGSAKNGANLIQGNCNTTGDEVFLFTKFQHQAFDGYSSGKWSPITPLGLVASSAALLPNGKVLYWSGSGSHSFHDTGVTQTFTGIYDPNTGSTAEKVVHTGHEMFCPAEVLLSDGRVLIVGGGGTESLRDRVTSYDYRTDSWKQESSLTIARWYSSATVLGDGRVFTIGGDSNTNSIDAFKGIQGQNRLVTRFGEIWSPAQSLASKWKVLTGITEPEQEVGGNYGLARLQYYPRTFLAPNGKLLEVAPSSAMRWIDTTGNGMTTIASVRPGAKNAQGPITAQLSEGKILLTGGSIAFGDEDFTKMESNYPAYRESYLIDLAQGSSVKAAPMRYPRYQANGVVLADGQVLAVGGSPRSKLFDITGAIMAPELYDPKTNAWTVMAPMDKPRIYHSVAVLLPDGRVWVAGGGQCGGCAVNEASAQIFSPPYLFRGARPTLHSEQAELKYGVNFNVNAHVSDGIIKRFTLVRLSAITHATNTDARLLELKATNSGGERYSLTAPKNGNIAPPGYYMLFAISDKGVPSVAAILKLS